MRKYKEKDSAPSKYCATVKLTEQTYKSDYSKCRIRKDLPKEKGMVFVLIPYERIAAEAITEIWGVDKKDAEKFKKAYIKAANETLRQSTPRMREKLERSSMSDKDKKRVGKVLEIVEAYQKKLKERNLPFPELINPSQLPAAPKKENAVIEEKKRIVNELLENKPAPIENTSVSKEVKPIEPEVSDTQATKTEKTPDATPITSNDAEKVESPEIPIIDLDKEEKTDTAKKSKIGRDSVVPDFSLGLTIDDLFDDEDSVPKSSQNTDNTLNDEPLPENYIDEYFETKEKAEDKTVKENTEPLPVSDNASSNDDEDDEDIYADLLS